MFIYIIIVHKVFDMSTLNGYLYHLLDVLDFTH